MILSTFAASVLSELPVFDPIRMPRALEVIRAMAAGIERLSASPSSLIPSRNLRVLEVGLLT